ncbi:MAG: cation:dicarboxylase symporter family transporter, partial [Holophagae bacterium]
MSDSPNAPEDAPARKLSLSQKIVIGLLAGIACGLFFGELCSFLDIAGSAFIALMQMTVLPYIVVALAVNIGSLTLDNARHLALRATVALLGIWAISVAVILILTLGLPHWPTGGFFSDAMVAEREAVDFVSLYIPANPFHSLAENVVPAVVLFSICFGVALIVIPNKRVLIDPLRTMLEALTRITYAVSALTPYGVFAIAANAAGTLTIDQIDKLQGYLLIYGAATLLLSFVVLPMAITVFTPFGYRDVLSASRGPLLTAFAANNYFIVLPMLIKSLEDLYQRRGCDGDDVNQTIDITLPIGFPFPNAGRLLALSFIPFGAWFVGRPLEVLEYPKLVLAGIPSLFAKVPIAIPFLLDLVRLPADLFRLFLITGILNGHLSSLAAAMHLFAFTAITTSAVTGCGRPNARRAVVAAAVSAALLLVCIVSIRGYLGRSLERSATDQAAILSEMTFLSPHDSVTTSRTPRPNPQPLAPGQTRLERISTQGAIRVCFVEDNLPFSYRNRTGEVVGLDVEMGHQLASDLGVGLELVSIDRAEDAAMHLENDHCDLAMSGFGASSSHLASTTMTENYLYLTPALVVPDHLRDDLDSVAELLEAEGVRLGVLNDENLVRLVRQHLPDAQPVTVHRVRDFF